MALETITLVVDKSWSLISNASGQFEAEVVNGSAVASIGATAPAAGLGSGRADRTYRYSALDGKVWMRAVGDSFATVVVTRVVDAGNVAAVTLPDATASASTFSSDLVAGAEIATLNANLAGASIERISPADGRVVLSSDRTKLVRGLSAVTAGPLDVTVYTNHPSAAASPKGTKITLTVNVPPLTITGAPPNAVPGQDYRWRPVIAGGNGRKTISVTGRLAEGWAVNETNGEVTARANSVRLALGSIPVGNITVTDADGAQATLGGVNITISTGSNPIIAPPASILIDKFDILNDTAGTARTPQGNGQNSGVVALSLDTTKKIEGAAGILIAQTTAANATIGVNTANAGSHDPAGIDIVAFYADISDRALVSNLSLNINRGAQTVSISQSDVPYPGGEWVVGEMSAHANYANFLAQGAGQLGHSARVSQSSPYGAAFTADALIKSAKGTPIFVFRYDDISQSQFDVAFQLHKKYNLPMSVNVPVDFIGQGGRWSEAMLAEAYASGLVELNCDSTRGDTGANITDSDVDRAAALASLMANHDGLVNRGFTRNNGHKQLIWANGIHSDKLATHFQNNGFQLMVSTLPGANYVKHGVGKGRAKILLSYPSVGTETYDGNWKATMDRALRLGLLHSQHCHGVSDSGNDTRPAELEKKLQRVRAEVDAGNALCLGFGAAFNAFGGFTTALNL